MKSIKHTKQFIDPDVALFYYNQLMELIGDKMYHLMLRNNTPLKSRLVYHYNPTEPLEPIEQMKQLVETKTGLTVNSVFINLFRPKSKDYLPYHIDHYDYQTVFTISLGDSNSSRNIRFREIKNTKNAKSFYQEPGDAHSFPLSLNQHYQHGIPTRNIKLSGRMSIVFFLGSGNLNNGCLETLSNISLNDLSLEDLVLIQQLLNLN